MDEDIVARYKKAYEEEFARADNDIVSRAQDELKNCLLPAVSCIREVIEHSANEALRVKAATYVIDRNLGTEPAAKDTMTALVQRLTAKPATSSSTAPSESPEEP